MKLALGMLVAISAACTTEPTFGPPLACASPPSSVCPGSACPSLDQVLNDPANCGGGPGDGYNECGGWTTVAVGDMFFTETYFFDGAFVAQITDNLGVVDCIGPASFAPPSCPGDNMTLPACR
jgi:hypothetical protein